MTRDEINDNSGTKQITVFSRKLYYNTAHSLTMIQSNQKDTKYFLGRLNGLMNRLQKLKI